MLLAASMPKHTNITALHTLPRGQVKVQLQKADCCIDV